MNTIELKSIQRGVIMKTVTMRVDDSVYDMIKFAAEGQKRNISNFIEFATLQYLTSSQFVENDEMAEILDDKELVKNLMNGLEDFKKGDYTIV
ncbi:CopG family transcriptional regulator [Arcobacter sp.]|uniref:CopG family transcriptional regulator n=1 Tax=Arcobacter sp. TaxID=1872629 RepID=UPI003D126A9E